MRESADQANKAKTNENNILHLKQEITKLNLLLLQKDTDITDLQEKLNQQPAAPAQEPDTSELDALKSLLDTSTKEKNDLTKLVEHLTHKNATLAS